MSLLFRVLYAIHARGTHHKLALDGVAMLPGADGEAWRRLLLKHAEPLMVGAKAPDDTFKDFKNHVLHARDGFWGGAPATARLWYDKLVEQLKAEAWGDAAYSAGVLSHYVTDPVHPFHTGQSEAENGIHRAFEWSTAKSYDALKQCVAGEPAPVIAVPDRPDWLEEMLRTAATQSNAQYEKLIAHYDIHRGVVDPPEGLDVVAQRILGRLVRTASTLFAIILERAIVQSGARPPEVSLLLDTILATLKIPIKQLKNRLADADDRREVERMYDELRATGTVEATLPEDDRIVRDQHRIEVLGVGAVPLTAATAELRAQAATAISEPALDRPASSPVAPVGLRPAVSPVASAAASSLSARLADAATAASKPGPAQPAAESRPGASVDSRDVAALSQADRAPSPTTDEARPVRAVPSTGGSVPQIGLPPRTGSPARVRLNPADDIVDAPSIGPRMAERLRPLGILTVKDLLDEDAAALAQALRMASVTSETVADWQAQARMVCTVPGLSGTGAQLFVGAGYRDAAAIAQVDTDKVCADLLGFAGSDKGRRILRDGEPPNVERIKAWAEGARMAKAA